MRLLIDDGRLIESPNWEQIEKALQELSPSRAVTLINPRNSALKAFGATLKYRIYFRENFDLSKFLILGRPQGQKMLGFMETNGEDILLCTPWENWSGQTGKTVFRLFFEDSFRIEDFSLRDITRRLSQKEMAAVFQTVIDANENAANRPKD